MVIISLGSGQCGIQVLHSLYEYLYNDIKQSKQNVSNSEFEVNALTRWFRLNNREQLCTRSVLVDSESKVIDSYTNNKLFEYENVVKKSLGGSANNWALGYCNVGPKVIEDVLDYVRNEVERCNKAVSFLMFQSTSGGTGSGTGSYIMERLRDEYPNKSLVSVIVLPYERGELVTQNYNTILSVRKLYVNCDLCLLFQNEKLHNLAEHLLKVEKVNYADLNKIIATKVASVFQPAGNNKIWSIVDQLIQHPNYKFAQIKSCPHSLKTDSRIEGILKWPELLLHAKQMLTACSQVDWELKYASSTTSARNVQYLKVLSNLLITRGKLDQKLDMGILEDTKMYPAWIPKENRLKHWHQNRSLNGELRYLSLVSNNNSLHWEFEKILEQAWLMLSHSACVHQYAKYGVTKDSFEESFIKVDNIIKYYKDL